MFPPLPGKFGIARQSNRGNQEKFVNDLCVIFPIRRYERLMRDGSLDRIVQSRNRSDCVSFRSVAPQLLIEFTWNTPDDFDLEVEEPDTNVIDRSTPNSQTGGRLNNDNNVGVCDTNKTGREQVRWLRTGSPLPGEYSIMIRHFGSCGNGPTTWSVAVINVQTVLKFETGTSNLDNNELVTTITFTL